MKEKDIYENIYKLCDSTINSIHKININSIKFYISHLNYLELELEEYELKKPKKIFKKKYNKWEDEYKEILLERKQTINKINQLIYDEKSSKY